jgi:hypothetical protein
MTGPPHRITMVGNDLAPIPASAPAARTAGSVPVGVGQPTLRMERITAGERASESENETTVAKPTSWRARLQLAAIVVVFIAKGALAEPHVPSGCGPTL